MAVETTPSAPADAAPTGEAAPSLLTTEAKPAVEAAKPDANGEAKPDAKTDPKAAKPEGEKKADADFTLKTPEGADLDEKTLGEFKVAAKELGLDGEKAQKVVDFYGKAQAQAAEAALAKLDETKAAWAKSCETDKEIGGQAFKENVGLARKAVDRFVSEEGKRFLAQSGLGNHPEFVRMFVRIGKADADDTVRGTRGNAGAQGDSHGAFLRQLYDHPASAHLLPKE